MALVFHHIGIPVKKSKLSKNARYSPLFKMYSEEAKNNLNIHIEYHAFDPGSSLDKRLQTLPHIAFKTNTIEKDLLDKEIIMPLYEPFKGYRCAAIQINDVIVELIETSLPEDKIWNDSDTINNGILYSNGITTEI